jgi:hypothetical protein
VLQDFILANSGGVAVGEPMLWCCIEINRPRFWSCIGAGVEMASAAVDQSSGKCEALAGPVDDDFMIYLVER